MRDENTILHEEAEAVRELQGVIRRAMDKRRKPLKAAAIDSGIGYPTLLSYFPDPASNRKPCALGLAGLRLLLGHMPPDLLSLLLPDGWQIVRAPEELDHFEVAETIADYLAAKQRAHHPDSPAGTEIAPCEDAELRAKLAVVACGQRAAA